MCTMTPNPADAEPTDRPPRRHRRRGKRASKRTARVHVTTTPAGPLLVLNLARGMELCMSEREAIHLINSIADAIESHQR